MSHQIFLTINIYLQCAKHLQSVMKSTHNFTPRIVVDHMDNGMSNLFAAHPERLVVVQSGIVKFIGGRGPEDYSVDALRNYLQKSC